MSRSVHLGTSSTTSEEMLVRESKSLKKPNPGVASAVTTRSMAAVRSEKAQSEKDALTEVKAKSVDKDAHVRKWIDETSVSQRNKDGHSSKTSSINMALFDEQNVRPTFRMSKDDFSDKDSSVISKAPTKNSKSVASTTMSERVRIKELEVESSRILLEQIKEQTKMEQMKEQTKMEQMKEQTKMEQMKNKRAN